MMNIEELKKQRKVKILLEGNTGSGKTFTAVKLAIELAKAGKKIKYIDTEYGATEQFILELDGVAPEITDKIEYVVNSDFKSIMRAFSNFEGFDYVVLDGLDDLYYTNIDYIENKIIEAGSYLNGEKLVKVKDIETFTLPWNMYSKIYSSLSSSLYRLLNSNCNFIVCFKSLGTSDAKERIEERIKAKFDTVIYLEKIKANKQITWRGRIEKNRGKQTENMVITDIVGTLSKKIGVK